MSLFPRGRCARPRGRGVEEPTTQRAPLSTDQRATRTAWRFVFMLFGGAIPSTHQNQPQRQFITAEMRKIAYSIEQGSTLKIFCSGKILKDAALRASRRVCQSISLAFFDDACSSLDEALFLNFLIKNRYHALAALNGVSAHFIRAGPKGSVRKVRRDRWRKFTGRQPGARRQVHASWPPSCGAKMASRTVLLSSTHSCRSGNWIARGVVLRGCV